MTAKTALAKKLLVAHQARISEQGKTPICFVGFDGFTDEILDAVDTRWGSDNYRPMVKMEQFGERIQKNAGKGCNIELVVREKKVGGNAPILTCALLEGGHRITFAGAIGDPEKIEPLFQKMASRCEKVIPLCPSGHSDAIEFHDGKVLLGKLTTLLDINYKTLLKQIEKDVLANLLDDADLFISANWTMLPHMTEMWLWIHDEILPSFSERLKSQPRWLFVDLADPAKRTDEDIAECLAVLKKLCVGYQVVLGLNEAEALRIDNILSPGENINEPRPEGRGVSWKGLNNPSLKDGVSSNFDEILSLATNIHQKSALHGIVVHTTRAAVGVMGQETATVNGPYTPEPALTTGAGDNFNAGFCNALLYKLSLQEALLSGVATSGYYVRNCRSPTITELAAFLKAW